MVKIWRADPEYGWAEVAIVENNEGTTFQDAYLRTPHGKAIVGEFSNLQLELVPETPGIQPDYCMAGGMLMVSEPLKAVLDSCKVNAQYFRFCIVREGRETGHAFYYCRILDIVECFDYLLGEYTFWQKDGFRDRVDGIKNLVIDETKTLGHPLFRIAKGGEHIICASDTLAGIIENGAFTGIKFVPPEQWNLC